MSSSPSKAFSPATPEQLNSLSRSVALLKQFDNHLFNRSRWLFRNESLNYYSHHLSLYS